MRFLWVVLLTGLFFAPMAVSIESDNSTFQKLSSSFIAISPDGSMLAVVNPDSNSVALVDTTSRTTQVEISVGIEPRSVSIDRQGRKAYVVNHGSDSITQIDLATHQVITEFTVGDRPVGIAIAPDSSMLAVAELGNDSVRLIETADLSTLAVIAVADRPHGLTFTPDGQRLLVTHLLSGQVSVISLDGFAISEIQTWPNVAPAPSVLVNSSGTRAYLPQTTAHGRGLNTQFDNTVFPKVSVLDLEAFTHLTSEHISLPETDQPVGLPWDAALTKNDTELWVVNSASNDLSVIDISDRTHPTRVANIAVADNPRGIVISPNEDWVYVNNTLAGEVSVIDANNYTLQETIQATQIPLPPILLRGKQIFHSSARGDLSRANWISCNTCHIEGEHDGRTWQLQFLGSVPAGAEPVIKRNTTSLLGMIETYPLRWSGEWDESADSEFSIRFEQFGTGLIHGDEMNPTLGSPNQGRSDDLDALAAFIDSLAVPERTHRLTAAEALGKELFESAQTQCAKCHPAPLYTDHQRHDAGTADGPNEWFGAEIDTPSLRFLYDSAPYLHDGSAATLRDVITIANSEEKHGVTSHLTEQEIENLIAFILALPYSDEE